MEEGLGRREEGRGRREMEEETETRNKTHKKTKGIFGSMFPA